MDTILLIIIGILSRLAPHPANLTAVGGLAIFSGAKLDVRKALFITVCTMFLSDLVLGFHSTMWATYGSLALGVIISNKYVKHASIARIGAVTLTSSVLFYLITNFAVWAIPGSMYPKTIAGLIGSYIMALPFFRNSAIGDFFYSGVFFGGAEFVSLGLNKIYSHRYHKAKQ